jgi:pimeloyl-ACP methyl ester carboxylesterase
MSLCQVHWKSEVLRKQVGAYVLLPDVGRPPFATLYLLHGLSDDHTTWLRRTRVEWYVRELPLIVVMPDGGRGFYTNNAGGPPFARYVGEELVGFVERNFPARPGRAARAIGGLSMGGYGAMRLALGYPEAFASANSHSGAFIHNHSPQAIAGGPLLPEEHERIFGPSPAGTEHDLAQLAQRAVNRLAAFGEPPKFEHHAIPAELPLSASGVGDYGQTAIADLDKDGHPDFILGRKGSRETSVLYWFRYVGPDQWEQHVAGHETRSDVGLAAVDVDGDGWIDLVTSGAWYKNPGKPGGQEFARHVFDERNSSAHDLLAVDIDGDGKLDIVTLRGPQGDYRAEDGLVWYRIPPDPTKPWERHLIGPGVHGAITPRGAGDIAGNGHTDLVVADTWYENVGGKGTEWVAHRNIPMGRNGPFGVCVRTFVADMDGDGRPEVVICDSDITHSKMAILKNADGHGGKWEKLELPQSFDYGSLHSLAVADFNGDGRPDIASNEQEELLPPGRTNPRWVVWENLGGLKFKEHIVLDARLGGHELQAADIDGDGRIDLCSKPWGTQPWNGVGGKMHVDFVRNVTEKK